MRFSSALTKQSRDAVEATRGEQRQRPDDIVVRRVGADTFRISTFDGKQIAICHDRFDAMRRACSAARQTGANVWIRGDGESETYGEVLCP